MTETIQAYPLQWPAGWRRCRSRIGARFHRRGNPQGEHGWRPKQELTVADALQRVLGELWGMGFDRDGIAISTNVPVRLDGLPRSATAEPQDPGAAVYWRNDRKGTRCMAIDRYDRVADNLAAIAATLGAMRAIERHGGAEILDRAFTGFKALPAPEQWFQVLGLDSPDVTEEQIQTAWREKAKEHHPDVGGDSAHMARINAARDRGLEAVRS
jgi:hypothetical protein